MNKNKITGLLFIVAFFILNGFKENKNALPPAEDKWSGSVTFHEKMTGPTIIRHDWWMIATITNNTGNALDSAIFENTNGGNWGCGSNDQTELELGIEKDKNEYGITVPVPGCNGLTDQTAIVINKQRLGSYPNVLSGNLVLRDSSADGTKTITTYTWDLRKSN